MIKDKINCWIWHYLPWLAIKLHSIGNNTVLRNAEFMDAYLQIIREGSVFLSFRDMFNIYYYVSRAREMEGDMAEVGVYQGKGAKLISIFKGNARLHLFDTFEGMPRIDETQDTSHQAGDFDTTSLEKVESYLKNFPNITYYKGFFPESVFKGDASSRKYSFVHLDGDIFQTTLDGLRFFYPRMIDGGVIISHDYASQTCPGVKAAFDIFSQETGILPIPLWDFQCMIIKSPGRSAGRETSANKEGSIQ